MDRFGGYTLEFFVFILDRNGEISFVELDCSGGMVSVEKVRCDSI